VHEPAMQGEIRVTVIATGFDRQLGTAGLAPEQPTAPVAPRGAPVIPFPAARTQRVTTPTGTQPRTDLPRYGPTTGTPARSQPVQPASNQGVDDMEIPTFIRRQMD
jgi:cell division protein FtsZ